MINLKKLNADNKIIVLSAEELIHANISDAVQIVIDGNIAVVELGTLPSVIVNAGAEPVVAEPEELRVAYDTVLNYDPFFGRNSGRKLRDIYADDNEFVVRARKELKNAFIKDKMAIIDKYLTQTDEDIYG